MIGVVLDTNVLINADKGEFSYAKRILDLVRRGKLAAVITDDVRHENLFIIERLVKDERLKDDIFDFLTAAVEVTPAKIKTVIDDDEDIKLLAAAVGGQAAWLITEDRHLLEVGEYQGVRIGRPIEFWQWWQSQDAQTDKSWRDWVENLFRS